MITKNTSFKWLIYTYIVGMSLSACFYILRQSTFDFSIFPFLALYFSARRFYQLYEQAEVLISPAWGSFFLGVFSYSALKGALHPELGSNWFSIIVTLVLLILVFYQTIFADKKSQA